LTLLSGRSIPALAAFVAIAILGLVLSAFSVALFVGLAMLRGQESWISRTPQST
jgi:hypothetical protein